jgi:hypothetical protein
MIPAKSLSSAERRRLKRVGAVWYLLFFDVLGSGSAPLLPIPHKVGQVLTQGALVVATLLALTVNPRLRVRPSLYLGILSVLAVTSLMSSIRLVSVGTAYRGLRLADFVFVLWLLTPWWGRKDQVLLRSQFRFLAAIMVVVVLGLLISPHSALMHGRLQGALWPIPPTQIAHYSAEFTGLAIMLWLAGAIRRRPALVMVLGGLTVLVLTHTRTALVGLAAGVLVGGASLFVTRRRVRQAFAVSVALVALAAVPLAPLVVGWLARGESASQLASLTGRTNFWGYVLAEQRPLTNEILGNGISNGSVDNPDLPGVSGLPIDSSWVEDYQDQGIAGDVLAGALFLTLLMVAAFSPRGPCRATALFLVVYCLVASFTEDGAGLASQYAMDLTVAASLLATRSGAVEAWSRRWARRVKWAQRAPALQAR